MEELESSEGLLVDAEAAVGPPVSHALVASVVGFEVLLLAVALIARARALTRASAADVAFEPASPVFAGSDFVSGTVELGRDETIAIKVEIRQRGSERKKKKGGWHHTWREYRRHTTANAFYLKRRGGERIRIEPDENVLLVDAVDTMRWSQPAARTRIAELTAGETAICEGVLERGEDPEQRGEEGYRSTARAGWVLRAAPGKRLHISTEGLGVRHRIKAGHYQLAAWIIGALTFVSVALLSTYAARAVGGQQTTAEIAGRRHYTTRSNNSTSHHYEVQLLVHLDDGQTYTTEEDIGDEDYRTLPEHAVMSFVYVGWLPPASSLGRGAAVSLIAWFISVVLMLGGVWALVRARRKKRWYEGVLVDTGPGRLPTPPEG